MYFLRRLAMAETLSLQNGPVLCVVGSYSETFYAETLDYKFEIVCRIQRQIPVILHSQKTVSRLHFV